MEIFSAKNVRLERASFPAWILGIRKDAILKGFRWNAILFLAPNESENGHFLWRNDRILKTEDESINIIMKKKFQFDERALVKIKRQFPRMETKNCNFREISASNVFPTAHLRIADVRFQNFRIYTRQNDEPSICSQRYWNTYYTFIIW